MRTVKCCRRLSREITQSPSLVVSNTQLDKVLRNRFWRIADPLQSRRLTKGTVDIPLHLNFPVTAAATLRTLGKSKILLWLLRRDQGTFFLADCVASQLQTTPWLSEEEVSSALLYLHVSYTLCSVYTGVVCKWETAQSTREEVSWSLPSSPGEQGFPKKPNSNKVKSFTGLKVGIAETGKAALVTAGNNF